MILFIFSILCFPLCQNVLSIEWIPITVTVGTHLQFSLWQDYFSGHCLTCMIHAYPEDTELDLPNWLNFDDQNITINGWPGVNDTGQFEIKFQGQGDLTRGFQKLTKYIRINVVNNPDNYLATSEPTSQKGCTVFFYSCTQNILDAIGDTEYNSTAEELRKYLNVPPVYKSWCSWVQELVPKTGFVLACQTGCGLRGLVASNTILTYHVAGDNAPGETEMSRSLLLIFRNCKSGMIVL